MNQIYMCQFEDHEGKPIIGYCLNQDCKLPPQCCTYCMNRKHSNHFDDCKVFKTLTALVQQIIGQQSQDLESHLLSLLQQVKQVIDKSIIDQKNDQDKLIQMLNEQNYQEIKNNIQLLRTCYNKSKTQTEKERQRNLINQFAHLCEQQKKVLSLFYIPKDKLFEEGKTLLKQTKYGDANYKFDQILSQNPQNCDVISQKGRALCELKKYKEAEDCLENGLKLNPNHSNLNLEKGYLLRKMQHAEQAFIYFNKAISLDPNNAEAYYQKGILLAKLEQDEKATQCYDKTIELDPTHVDAYLYKGISLDELQIYEEAIKSFDVAISLDPNYALAYMNKGIIILDEGNTLSLIKRCDEAIKCYDKAIELDPDDPYLYKGMTLFQQRKYNESLICLDQAIEIDSDDEKAYKEKGEVLKKLKQYKNAKKYYTLAIEKGYEPKEKLQILITNLDKK